MGSVEQAQAAVAALNNQDYRGRKLFLDFAKSEDPAPDVREKQLQTAQQAASLPPKQFTPMTHTPIEEPVHPEVHEEPAPEMPVEEVHPQMQAPEEPVYQPEPEAEIPAEEAHPEMQPPMEAPVNDIPAAVQQDQPQQPAQPQPEEQPIRNFGTIFSNSPGKNNE
jgi:hypothetical protein